MFRKIQCNDDASFEGQNRCRHRYYLLPFRLFPAEPLERLSIQLKVLITLPLLPVIILFGDLLPFPHETTGSDREGVGVLELDAGNEH